MARPPSRKYKRRFRSGMIFSLWAYVRLRAVAHEANEADVQLDTLRAVVSDVSWRTNALCSHCRQAVSAIIAKGLP